LIEDKNYNIYVYYFTKIKWKNGVSYIKPQKCILVIFTACIWVWCIISKNNSILYNRLGYVLYAIQLEETEFGIKAGWRRYNASCIFTNSEKNARQNSPRTAIIFFLFLGNVLYPFWPFSVSIPVSFVLYAFQQRKVFEKSVKI